jgi:hypothetical protein
MDKSLKKNQVYYLQLISLEFSLTIPTVAVIPGVGNSGTVWVLSASNQAEKRSVMLGLRGTFLEVMAPSWYGGSESIGDIQAGDRVLIGDASLIYEGEYITGACVWSAAVQRRAGASYEQP